MTGSKEIDMKDGKVIKDINDGGYNYLGAVEAEKISLKEIKKIKREHMSRVRSILKSKLNCGHTILIINSWVIRLVRYTAGIVE